MTAANTSSSGVSHVKKCDWLVKNMTDWRLEVDLKKLNDWLMTCHNMTSGCGVMTTLASETHTRRIDLATRTGNQSALFMMSINWYYVKYELTVQQASQQKRSLGLSQCVPVSKVKLWNQQYVLFCRFAIKETNFVLTFTNSFIAIFMPTWLRYVRVGLFAIANRKSICRLSVMIVRPT